VEEAEHPERTIDHGQATGKLYQSTGREPPTMGKQLVNFITCGLREPLTMGKQLVNFITCGWKRTTDPGQATGKLYHLRLPIECTLFCNLQSRSRTHAVLEPPTMGKQLVNFIICGCKLSALFFVICKAECKPMPYW